MINILVDEQETLLWSQIAYFLDQPEFISGVEEVRKCWLIHDANFISLHNFDNWYNDYHLDFSLSKSAVEYYSKLQDKVRENEIRGGKDTIESLTLLKKWSELNPFELEVELFERMLGINAKYEMVIVKAIACNSVEEKDIRKVTPDFKYDFVFDISGKTFRSEKMYEGKPKTEIVRDRAMYFANKEDKKSQNVIAKEEGLSREAVKEALKRYRKFLQS